jgi:hypothetical protein
MKWQAWFFAFAVLLPMEASGQATNLNANKALAVESLTRTIELTEQRKLPEWSAESFAFGMKSYLTQDFINAVGSGRKIASSRSLNIWDGNLLTGAQMWTHMKLWRAEAVAPHVPGVMKVYAAISTTDGDEVPSDPGYPTESFIMKLEDNVWKIDDVALLPSDGKAENVPATDKPPGLKELFLQPAVYVRPQGYPADARPYKGKIPLQVGHYAKKKGGCPAFGGAYLSTLAFDGMGLNNTLIFRSITDTYSTGDAFYLGLSFQDQEVERGGLIWKLKPLSADSFELVGADRDGDWSGTYWRCKFSAPDAQPVTASPARASAVSDVRPKLNVRQGIFDGERGLSFLHNNSWVWVFARAGLIVYYKPSDAMKGLVRPGDVLFRGNISRGGVAGTAYAFRQGCPPLGYEVGGPEFDGDPAGTIIMKGRRPMRAGHRCAPSESRVVAETLEFDGEAGIGD